MPPTLAAIGDSLTQGFQSGAISNTGWSFPAIVARSLGLEVPTQFRVPRIPGRGLPLNIEDMLRWMTESVGPDLSTAEWVVRFPALAARYLDLVEDYYERGDGRLPAKYGGVFHNLAVWGYTVFDSQGLDWQSCEAIIQHTEGWIDDDFLGIPSAPMYRTAQRVLNPMNDPVRRLDSQLDALERLVQAEPVDVLVVWLGANDCLGTVLGLEIHDMDDADGPIPADSAKRVAWNLTSPHQFATDYADLAERVRAIVARSVRPTKVFVATVPHVTIPPVTSGVGRFDGKYFERYGRFFVDDGNVSAIDKTLGRDDARRIDARIDAFNATIRAAATDAGWNVVDICDVLDRLAVKRNGFTGTPDRALREYYAAQPDHPLLGLDPVPSVLMLKTDRRGRRVGGGLFSLDGVHPSTIGYGLIAEAFLAAMAAAGVPGADPRRLPWASLIGNDSLLQAPPALWDDVCDVAHHHATLWDLVFRAMA